MNFDQLVTLAVLAAVVAALISDKVRADVVALTGAAVLLMTGFLARDLHEERQAACLCLDL